MNFTDEQKSELAQIVATAMDGERERRIARMRAERESEPPKDTRLYLVTMTHHQIAFPDERGRAVLTQTFYARIQMKKDDPQFYGGRVEVVAFGDGKVLDHPVVAVLSSGVCALVETNESQLEICSKQ